MQDARYEADGVEISGKRIRVTIAKPRRKGRRFHRSGNFRNIGIDQLEIISFSPPIITKLPIMQLAKGCKNILNVNIFITEIYKVIYFIVSRNAGPETMA